MKNYADFYAHISRPFVARGRELNLLNQLITRLMYAVYPLFLTYLYLENSKAVLPYILIPGISFVLLSLVRKALNKPRPYEAWDISPLLDKDSSGESLPSRHVFSATIISMCVLTVNVWLGLVLLLVSAILAFCRVVGGVHYPKDVVAGYGIGLILGLLLFL